MQWIALAAALGATAPVAEHSPAPQRQARATVRIVKAATIRQANPRVTDAEGAIIRESRSRAPDPVGRRVKLLEFY